MKLKINKISFLLIFIFILTLVFRVYFTFQSDNFGSDQAYFHYRHIDSLTKGNFIYYDDLSYGGRYVVYPVFFHLILAVLTFGNIFLLKLIPEILLSSVVFLVFLLSKEITRNDNISLITALFSGFIPLFLVETINNLSVYSFVIPLILLTLYGFMDLNKRLKLFLVVIFLLALTHLSSFLIVLGLLFYVFLLIGENIKLERLEKEVIFLVIIVVIFFSFIVYKKAFLEYGLGIFSQGIPSIITSDYFKDVNVLDMVLGVGILPLIFGSYGVFIGMKEKGRLNYLLNGFVFSVFILLVFRLMEFYIGIMILGILLAVSSSSGLVKLLGILERTRVSRMKSLIVLGLLMLIVVLMIFPVIGLIEKKGFVHDQKIHDLKWIKENSEEGDVVLGLLNEGHVINAVAERRNVIDGNFLLADNPLKRMEDVDIIYKTGSEAIALELLRKYNIRFIYFSDDAKRIYDELRYVGNEECFKRLRSRVYEVIC